MKTFRDRAFNYHWTTGGICQCRLPVKYGAFFVRSRITGPGANTVELLWPWNNASWPPELDFNENLNHVFLTTSTTHWGTVDHAQFDIIRINMLNWHTWGVIWTPSYVLYVVDGRPGTSSLSRVMFHHSHDPRLRTEDPVPIGNAVSTRALGAARRLGRRIPPSLKGVRT